MTSLAGDTMPRALEHLDRVEGAVRGLYTRRQIVTGSGHPAWAYEYGTAPDDAPIPLTRLHNGDWLLR